MIYRVKNISGVVFNEEGITLQPGAESHDLEPEIHQRLLAIHYGKELMPVDEETFNPGESAKEPAAEPAAPAEPAASVDKEPEAPAEPEVPVEQPPANADVAAPAAELAEPVALAEPAAEPAQPADPAV